MPLSNKLNITDLEFDEIKANLIDFLKGQSQFQDYDFEGSGMSIILDLLSYNTHYMGYYANMLGNEMFLDSSSLRESAVSHAKHLNVFPTSVKAAKAAIDMTFTPTGNPISLTIAKNTKFVSSINGIPYTFVTNKTTNIPRTSTGNYSVENVELVEGKILNKRYTVNAADDKQRFIIPNPNVDTTTIVVKVQKTASDSAVVTYKDGNALDVTTIKGSDKVFFTHEIDNQQYEITFGDGAVGAQLEDGNIIFVEYIVTSGEAANFANTFKAVGSVAGLNSENYTLTTRTSAGGGAPIQTIDSLQFQAPKLYQAQRRATTKNDYKAIILEQRPDIESIVVIPGEDAEPTQYGKVFIGVKPSGNNTFSTAAKEAIKESILKAVNVVTVQPEIVDPIFYYILVDTIVNYDPVTNLTDADTLKLNIDASVQNYFQTNLEKFNQKFRYSQLVQDIDNTSSAVRNNKTTIRYRQLISPATLNTPATYTINFNNEIKKGSVTSTTFTAPDGLTYCLVDDSVGNIKLAKASSNSNGEVTSIDSPRVFYIQPDGSTNQGTIDFTTGKIVLNSFRPLSITSQEAHIKLTVTPEVNNSDITPLREQVLTYDVNETDAINISMVAETII